MGLFSGGVQGANDTCQPYSLPKCKHHVAPKSPYKPCGKATPGPKCQKQCTNKDYGVSFEDDKSFGRSVYDVLGDEAHIMEEIERNGPVVATFDVYTDFLNYASGVYRYTNGTTDSSHAVRIIGWGQDGT